MSELPESLQRARAAAYAAWRSATGQSQENPELQGYLNAPGSRPEIESQMGLPAHLRQQQRPFGNQAALGRVNPRTQVPVTELSGEAYPFPGRVPMVDDPRAVRLQRGPPDPFERGLPPAPAGLLRSEMRQPSPPEGHPGFAPKDAAFQLDPDWVMRNPSPTMTATYGDFISQNGNQMVRNRPLARGDEPRNIYPPIPEAPMHARRPIETQTMAEREAAAWRAARASVQADIRQANESGPAWRRHAPGLGAPNYTLSRRR